MRLVFQYIAFVFFFFDLQMRKFYYLKTKHYIKKIRNEERASRLKDTIQLGRHTHSQYRELFLTVELKKDNLDIGDN